MLITCRIDGELKTSNQLESQSINVNVRNVESDSKKLQLIYTADDVTDTITINIQDLNVAVSKIIGG